MGDDFFLELGCSCEYDASIVGMKYGMNTLQKLRFEMVSRIQEWVHDMCLIWE